MKLPYLIQLKWHVSFV